MVTGDNPVAAKGIAESVGIITGETVDDIALRTNLRTDSVDSR